MFGRVMTWQPGDSISAGWGLAILGLTGVHALCFFHYHEDLLQRLRWPARIALVTATLIAIATLGATARPFIYFQF